MTDSASLKIDRAAKHIAELNKLLEKSRPFVLVVHTNIDTRKRTLLPKRNKAIINEIGLICGDVVHNLRAALDHAYWEIIESRCANDWERKRTQFPFSETESGYLASIEKRFGNRAGTGFYCALRLLRSHGETGGNELLALIHTMDIVDKHKLLIPTADYVQVSGDQLRSAIPGFNVIGGSGMVGITSCIFEWEYGAGKPTDAGHIVAPTLNKFERELDIPLDVIFQVGPLGKTRPIVPTLNQLINTTRETIAIMRESANSY